MRCGGENTTYINIVLYKRSSTNASCSADIKTRGRGLSEPGAQQASEHTPGALLSHITQDPPPQISLLPHY